jgi:hypothetical protein
MSKKMFAKVFACVTLVAIVALPMVALAQDNTATETAATTDETAVVKCQACGAELNQAVIEEAKVNTAPGQAVVVKCPSCGTDVTVVPATEKAEEKTEEAAKAAL